jgi:hypothetical protein
MNMNINSDKHLPQSPFAGQFFRWRHFALVSIKLNSLCLQVASVSGVVERDGDGLKNANKNVNKYRKVLQPLNIFSDKY